ncbi:MAG TPA: FAD-dependent oxidoreductase [Gaiellaceae bacterium]|jgi:sarcosine oxidase|nr:FAD-dependent oxidoreductase [Gaiellaceae bacterium]
MTRVAVVGAGVMGCAAAWALSARGADVTLVEQFDLDHERGSSHGRTRIVRLSYPEAHWVELARAAMDGWRDLEADAGQELLGLHGIVELAPDPALTSAAGLAACGVDYKWLDAPRAHELGALLPDGWAALHQTEAGFVHADRARHAFVDVARARGAVVETGRRVESVDDVDADVVVVTAGSWIRELVPDVPVTVTRETIAYFRRDGAPQPAIVELDEITRGHGMYSLHDPVHGLKAGEHHGGPVVDPRSDGAPDLESVRRVSDWVAARLPSVDPEPIDPQTCLYTSTADGSFVLERRGRVVVGSACSGHGFKFAPVVGRRLAELALG